MEQTYWEIVVWYEIVVTALFDPHGWSWMAFGVDNFIDAAHRMNRWLVVELNR